MHPLPAPEGLLTHVPQDVQTSRPANQHRLSSSAMPSSSLSVRQSSSRNHSHSHSHSNSLGAINPSHRVTRRKSMTSAAATNVAAMAAAIHEATEASYDLGTPSKRRSMTSSRAVGPKGAESASVGGAPGVGGYPLSENATGHGRASHAAGGAKYAARDGSAVADDLPSSSALENDVTNNKGRGRRASEGAHLVKGEGRRISGGELRCDQCGKGYKHSSCLTKHLSVPIVSYPPQTLPHEYAIPLCAKPQHARWILVAHFLIHSVLCLNLTT